MMRTTIAKLRQIIKEVLMPGDCEHCWGSGKAYTGFNQKDLGLKCDKCGGTGKEKKQENSETDKIDAEEIFQKLAAKYNHGLQQSYKVSDADLVLTTLINAKQRIVAYWDPRDQSFYTGAGNHLPTTKDIELELKFLVNNNLL
jgi:DnaJ-class molecular chaperone